MRRAGTTALTIVGVGMVGLLFYVWSVIVWSVATSNDDGRGYLTATALTLIPAGLVVALMIRARRRGDPSLTLKRACSRPRCSFSSS